MGSGGQWHVPAALPLGKRPGTNCIGGWLGLRACLNGGQKIACSGILSSDRPAHSVSLLRTTD